MPKGKSTSKRGRKTKHTEVRDADIKRLKKYGIPLALTTALASGGYKIKPQLEKYLSKNPKHIRREVKVLLKNPDAVIRMVEMGNKDVAYLDAYSIINKNLSSKFGNYLAPINIRAGNNEIAMNDPFSAIYVNDTPQTWGTAHDQSSNLSGFPWYKGQVPTLAIKPSFGTKAKTVKRKVTKRKTVADNGKKWVQKAVKRPGSLTAYAKKVAPRKAFTKRGTLRVAWLREIVKSDKSSMRRNQARLALRLKKMNSKNKTVKKNVKKNVKKSKTLKRKTFKPRKKRKSTTKNSKFGGKFNYTINQYATNQGTPNLNQLSKISGNAAYDYPIAGPSANGMNLSWFDSKTNQAGMGLW
jgi:hypothetical protein